MQVVRRLTQVSDLVATNSSRHLEWLEREAIPDGVPAVRLLPMFSNVGESAEPPNPSARQPKLVVFGLADTRRKAFRRLSSLGDLLRTLGISEILDVGPEFDAPAELNGVPIRRMGVLAAPELAAILSQTMFGFVQHASICLAKSGVFAGFCALGTIPLVAEDFQDEVDGLKDGVHLVSPRTAAAAVAGGLEKCSNAAWHWYSRHRLHVHAETYAGWVDRIVTEAESLSASRAAGA
jgi:hypothetical protein